MKAGIDTMPRLFLIPVVADRDTLEEIHEEVRRVVQEDKDTEEEKDSSEPGLWEDPLVKKQNGPFNGEDADFIDTLCRDCTLEVQNASSAPLSHTQGGRQHITVAKPIGLVTRIICRPIPYLVVMPNPTPNPVVLIYNMVRA